MADWFSWNQRLSGGKVPISSSKPSSSFHKNLNVQQDRVASLAFDLCQYSADHAYSVSFNHFLYRWCHDTMDSGSLVGLTKHHLAFSAKKNPQDRLLHCMLNVDATRIFHSSILLKKMGQDRQFRSDVRTDLHTLRTNSRRVEVLYRLPTWTRQESCGSLLEKQVLP